VPNIGKFMESAGSLSGFVAAVLLAVGAAFPEQFPYLNSHGVTLIAGAIATACFVYLYVRAFTASRAGRSLPWPQSFWSILTNDLGSEPRQVTDPAQIALVFHGHDNGYAVPFQQAGAHLILVDIATTPVESIAAHIESAQALVLLFSDQWKAAPTYEAVIKTIATWAERHSERPVVQASLDKKPIPPAISWAWELPAVPSPTAVTDAFARLLNRSVLRAAAWRSQSRLLYMVGAFGCLALAALGYKYYRLRGTSKSAFLTTLNPSFHARCIITQRSYGVSQID
jgi:hypothetical protein